MDFYRPPSNTTDGPFVATPAVIERNVYDLKAALLADVMFEQLEYLIGHSDGDCPPDCIDCTRLQQVRNLLLLPFRCDS